jgi:predicted DsbA family dithiol-disulfide isomerase
MTTKVMLFLFTSIYFSTTDTIFAQTVSDPMSLNKSSAKNPLVCSPKEGVCKTPGLNQPQTDSLAPTKNKPLLVHYFTDPICSACWGIEPQLRRLKLEYGDLLEIRYHMGGLLPSWTGFDSGGISKPSDVATHWDEVSAYYEMPMIGDVWLNDPLNSSFPPCVAFKAAQIQSEYKAIAFMRRLREMVFLAAKNITKWEYLNTAAYEAGLDTVQFKADYLGRAHELFDEDLRITRQMGVRGFPTLFFTDADQNRTVINGVKPYQYFEQAIMRLLPTAVKKTIDASTPEKAFELFPTLTAKEFAVLSNQSLAAADASLNEYYNARQCTRFVTRNGTLYQKLSTGK